MVEYETEATEGANAIQFNKVSFTYPSRAGKVLNSFSLGVARGQVVAIAGSSGCGKSTLISLLNRFYDCDEGSVEIGGVNIQNIPLDNLRKMISVVSQEVSPRASSAVKGGFGGPVYLTQNFNKKR